MHSNSSGGERPPSVLLLGWGAARMRHLRPYKEWYRARDHAVLAHIIDPGVLRGGRFLARDMRRVTSGLRDLEGPYIVHLFSRTGFVNYAYLLASDVGARLRAAVVGHVFDSAPGVPMHSDAATYAEQMTQGLLAAVMTPSSRVPAPMRRLVFATTNALFRAHYHLVPGVSSHFVQALRRYVDHAPAVPILFLCSPADALVDIRSIEAFAARERARGVRVVWQPFASSRHVQHMRQYPDEYSASLQAFVRQLTAR